MRRSREGVAEAHRHDLHRHDLHRHERADLVGKEVKITEEAAKTLLVVSRVASPMLIGHTESERITFDLTRIEKLQVKGPLESLESDAFIHTVVPLLILVVVAVGA